MSIIINGKELSLRTIGEWCTAHENDIYAASLIIAGACVGYQAGQLSMRKRMPRPLNRPIDIPIDSEDHVYVINEFNDVLNRNNLKICKAPKGGWK